LESSGLGGSDIYPYFFSPWRWVGAGSTGCEARGHQGGDRADTGVGLGGPRSY
ncbi:hypothetical protein FOZ61_002126, partial [Perkinsus olseni]